MAYVLVKLTNEAHYMSSSMFTAWVWVYVVYWKNYNKNMEMEILDEIWVTSGKSGARCLPCDWLWWSVHPWSLLE